MSPVSAANRKPGWNSFGFLLTIYLVLLGFLWIVIPSKNQAAIVATGLAILAVVLVGPWRPKDVDSPVGLNFRYFVPVLQDLAVPMVVAAIVLVGVNRLTGASFDATRFPKRFVQILPWALLQQFLLQGTFNRRFAAVMGNGLKSSALNGLFFAGMHLPGLLLTSLTFVAGTWWSFVYQRKPNVWALVLSHALLSALAQTCLPAAWTHGFRVGPGYFRWH